MSGLVITIDPMPRRPRDSEANRRHILAIASGKGGVGKTFVSISLAHAFAESGRRVLLFDGDLGLANIDVQLGLMPERDLVGVVSGRMTLAQARTPYAPGRFDVIAGRSGAGSLAAMPPTRLAALGSELVQLAEDYDIVVMDLGAGVDRMVRHLASFSTMRVVVANAEPTSLTDAYALIKVMLADRPDADLRIVINQARSRAEGERTFATLERACRSFLKYQPKLAGVIQRDRRVIEAIRAQTPLTVKYPSSEPAADIRAVMQGLMAS